MRLHLVVVATPVDAQITVVPADFTQLRKGKPSSTASLEKGADEAVVAESLRATVESESGRTRLSSSL
jgi:hypothetical protein